MRKAAVLTGTDLTVENVKAGLVIFNKANPSWGTFRITKHYSEGIWETDKKVIFEGEFRLWAIKD